MAAVNDLREDDSTKVKYTRVSTEKREMDAHMQLSLVIAFVLVVIAALL